MKTPDRELSVMAESYRLLGGGPHTPTAKNYYTEHTLHTCFCNEDSHRFFNEHDATLTYFSDFGFDFDDFDLILFHFISVK